VFFQLTLCHTKYFQKLEIRFSSLRELKTYLLFSTAHRLAATATLLAFLMHVHLLHYSLFLCTCRQTCCNVTGSPLARGQWLAAAPLAFLMHVHTELLLRYLLVLRMAGRRAFYATCSSYAWAHWLAAAPLVFLKRPLRRCTDNISIAFGCGGQTPAELLENLLDTARAG
jgi:hypothetical protein